MNAKHVLLQAMHGAWEQNLFVTKVTGLQLEGDIGEGREAVVDEGRALEEGSRGLCRWMWVTNEVEQRASGESGLMGL